MKFINRITYRNLIQMRNSSSANKIHVEVGYANLFVYILNFFYRKGYIFGYMFITAFKIRVFLKYFKDKGLLKGISFRLGRPNFSFKSLKYLAKSPYMLNYLYLFSTSKGFLTLDEIFFNNLTLGGILYFYIVLQ